MAHNFRARVTHVLVVGSFYQFAILVHFLSHSQVPTDPLGQCFFHCARCLAASAGDSSSVGFPVVRGSTSSLPFAFQHNLFFSPAVFKENCFPPIVCEDNLFILLVLNRIYISILDMSCNFVQGTHPQMAGVVRRGIRGCFPNHWKGAEGGCWGYHSTVRQFKPTKLACFAGGFPFKASKQAG